MKPIADRLIDLEVYVTSQDKMLEELNAEVLRQGKLIDMLVRDIKRLRTTQQESNIKPLSEETPPPHY